jgi:glycosyltransferase involved in cell wall biosynthesis
VDAVDPIETVTTLAERLHALDQLNPAACRRAAEERFSPAQMAEQYLRHYEEVLRRAGARRTSG